MSLFHGKLNSDYFKAYSLGRSVTVFVENESDVPFWSRVLRKYAPPRITFRFPFACRKPMQRGKPGLLVLKEGLDDFLLLCVDSDYDYVLQDATADSQTVNQNPYILQTYTYSIENYQCFAESLHDLCVQATYNAESVFDFVEFLHAYSVIVYELFLFTVYFRKIGNSKAFTDSDCAEFFGLRGTVNVRQNAEAILQELQTRVESKVAALKSEHPHIDIQMLSDELALLGLQPKHTYLLVKGHTIYNNLVLILLRSVEKVLRDKKYAEFAQQAANEQELSQKRQEYKNLILDIETLLASNVGYDSCFLMGRIQRDIHAYVQISCTGRIGTAVADA